MRPLGTRLHKYRNKKGQALTEYLLLVAIIFAMISIVLSLFEKATTKIVTDVEVGAKQIVANGAIKTGHPILEKRARDLRELK